LVAQRVAAAQGELKLAQETMRSLGEQIAEKELRLSTYEGDLKIEREWRQSLQQSSVKDKERISELNMSIQKLQMLSSVWNLVS